MTHKKELNNLLRIVVVCIASLVNLLSIYVSFYLKFWTQIPMRNFQAFQASYLWILLGFIVIHILFGTYIFYNKTYLDLFYFTFLGQVFMMVFMMALSYAGAWLTFPRSVILLNLLVGTGLLYVFNAFSYWLYHRLSGRKRIMILGQKDQVFEAVVNFSRMTNQRHQVVFVGFEDYYQKVQDYSDQIDIVYLTGYVEEAERLRIYEYLMRQDKKLFLGTQFANLMMVNPNIMSFEDESIIELSGFTIPFEQAILKRSLDILVALTSLVLLSPVMLVTALAIHFDSPGPVFYKQERVTKGQKVFKILKFRSMSQEAEQVSGPVLASSNDQRITKVGKFIRSTRIDELPQMINVLKGEMSLVGPRPERPFFVNQFKQQNPYYDLRHQVRAGITGYAQVYGKYATDFNSKLNFDLLYIKNYSLAFDFKLLFQTLKILFDKVSARGIEEQTLNQLSWEDFKDQLQILED